MNPGHFQHGGYKPVRIWGGNTISELADMYDMPKRTVESYYKAHSTEDPHSLLPSSRIAMRIRERRDALALRYWTARAAKEIREMRCGWEGPCQGKTELFFSSAPSDEEEARKMCADCPFAMECLDLALRQQEEHGIWGGSTPYERAYILRKDEIRPRWTKGVRI
jgi:hypothetical protein